LEWGSALGPMEEQRPLTRESFTSQGFEQMMFTDPPRHEIWLGKITSALSLGLGIGIFICGILALLSSRLYSILHSIIGVLLCAYMGVTHLLTKRYLAGEMESSVVRFHLILLWILNFSFSALILAALVS
jgi:hypothetical protein